MTTTLTTTPAAEAPAAPATIALNRADALAVEEIASEMLTVADGRMDDVAWLGEASRRSHDLPVSLRRALAEYRRDPGSTGAFVIRGLPVDEALLPATVAVSGSAQRAATIPATTLMLITHVLGYPIGYRGEKNGAMVHDVVPVPGSEEFQGNEGSVLLTFHTENAFHDHRPNYVLLLCLRADHDRIAGLRTASIRQVHSTLSQEALAALRRPDFITEPPPSFGAMSGAYLHHAVLNGSPEDPDVLVDFSATRPLTAQAAAAMAELQARFAEHALIHLLLPGDLAIVDNRVTVHGRTAFTPRYDGRDRWLQRTFAVQDLRRSRLHRAEDGYVLVS